MVCPLSVPLCPAAVTLCPTSLALLSNSFRRSCCAPCLCQFRPTAVLSRGIVSYLLFCPTALLRSTCPMPVRTLNLTLFCVWQIYRAGCCCWTFLHKIATCRGLSGDFPYRTRKSAMYTSRNVKTFGCRAKEALGVLSLRNNALRLTFKWTAVGCCCRRPMSAKLWRIC